MLGRICAPWRHARIPHAYARRCEVVSTNARRRVVIRGKSSGGVCREVHLSSISATITTTIAAAASSITPSSCRCLHIEVARVTPVNCSGIDRCRCSTLTCAAPAGWTLQQLGSSVRELWPAFCPVFTHLLARCMAAGGEAVRWSPAVQVSVEGQY